jgi:hypothetical protein
MYYRLDEFGKRKRGGAIKQEDDDRQAYLYLQQLLGALQHGRSDCLPRHAPFMTSINIACASESLSLRLKLFLTSLLLLHV